METDILCDAVVRNDVKEIATWSNPFVAFWRRPASEAAAAAAPCTACSSGMQAEAGHITCRVDLPVGVCRRRSTCRNAHDDLDSTLHMDRSYGRECQHFNRMQIFQIFHRNSETHAKSLPECVHRQKMQKSFRTRSKRDRTRSERVHAMN